MKTKLIQRSHKNNLTVVIHVLNHTDNDAHVNLGKNLIPTGTFNELRYLHISLSLVDLELL